MRLPPRLLLASIPSINLIGLLVSPTACRYDNHLVSNPDDAGALFEYWAQPVMARWAIGMLSEVRLAPAGTVQLVAMAFIAGCDVNRSIMVAYGIRDNSDAQCLQRCQRKGHSLGIVSQLSQSSSEREPDAAKFLRVLS